MCVSLSADGHVLVMLLAIDWSDFLNDAAAAAAAVAAAAVSVMRA